jgi:hypothetical protein
MKRLISSRKSPCSFNGQFMVDRLERFRMCTSNEEPTSEPFPVGV